MKYKYLLFGIIFLVCISSVYAVSISFNNNTQSSGTVINQSNLFVNITAFEQKNDSDISSGVNNGGFLYYTPALTTIYLDADSIITSINTYYQNGETTNVTVVISGGDVTASKTFVMPQSDGVAYTFNFSLSDYGNRYLPKGAVTINTIVGSPTTWFAYDIDSYNGSIISYTDQYILTCPWSYFGGCDSKNIFVVSNESNFSNTTINIYNYDNELVNSSVQYSSGVFYYNFTNLSPDIYYFNATVYNIQGGYSTTETRTLVMIGNQSVAGNQSVYPLSFSQTKGAGDVFSFVTEVNTNSTANLSFISSCTVPNSNFTCVVPNFSVSNVSLFVPINFTSNVLTPDGIYNASVNFTRLLDGRVDTVNFSLNVATNLSILEYSCYQESANTTNQTGIDGRCGLDYSGSYGFDLSTSSYYINYTVPIDALNSSSWLVYRESTIYAYIDPIYENISIGQCLSSGNKLRFKIVASGVGTAYTNIGYCYNGTTWIELFNGGYSFCGGTGSPTSYTNSFDGNWATGSYVYNNVQVQSIGTSDCKRQAMFFEEAMDWRYFPFFSYYNISSFSLGNNFSIVSNISSPASLVNYSVTLPNSSIVNFTSSFINGFWVSSSNLTAFVGNYSVLAYSNPVIPNGLIPNKTWNFTISDAQYFYPLSFSQTKGAGDVFSFVTEVNTNSTANLSFISSCTVPNSNFTCVVSNFSVSNVSLFVPINFTSNVLTPDGIYNASVNFTRLLDGRVDTVNFSLNVQTNFGIPFIVNSSQSTVSMYSNQVRVVSFNLSNSGNYNLSDCYGQLSGSFIGWSFYNISTILVLAPNESVLFNVTYSLPPTGAFSGYLNIICVATITNLSNSLSVSNQPLLVLSSSQYIPPVPPNNGGGGGSSSVYQTVFSNVSSFSLFNSAGSSNGYVSYSYPSESFSKTFIVESKVSDTLNLVPTCLGDFCQYVTFSKAGISLAGFGSDFFTANVVVPKSVALDGVYSYQVVLTDNSGESVSLTNQVHISSLSAWYSKFSPSVEVGSAGFWFSLGSFAVPKLLLYLLLVLFVDAGLYFLLPKSKFVGKNIILILTFASLIVFGLSALIY